MPSVLVVSVDITTLVETERALKKRVEQLQLTLDASGAVLWSADLRQDLLLAEEEFFDLLGYHPDETPHLFSHWLSPPSCPRRWNWPFRTFREGWRRAFSVN